MLPRFLVLVPVVRLSMMTRTHHLRFMSSFIQGVNRITVWPGCQEERMLDPDAIWIADENTCVDGPKGRTVPKWLA